MKKFDSLNLELLGAPIGDFILTAKFVSNLHSKAHAMLSRLQQVGTIDPQVLLRFSSRPI